MDREEHRRVARLIPVPGPLLDDEVLAAIDLLRAGADILEKWGDQAESRIAAARLAKDAIDALLKGDEV